MRHNVLETVVGAIVIIMAGFFLMFAYQTTQTDWSKGGYLLYAKFDRIDGLNLGSDVKISGVKVGTIKSIDLDPNTYQASVGILIKNSIQLPSDSSAEVVSESLLGGKFVAVVPGGSEVFLKPKESIFITQSSISFESLLSKFIFNKSPQESRPEAQQR